MLTLSILVVDNESFVCKNLMLKLKRLNLPEVEYELDSCENGNQAVEQVKRKSYDIIFTDIRMPFFSGLSLIQVLRASGCQSKIWVLSGHDDFETVRTAFLNGADDFLLKPLEIAQLDQKLRAYLALRKPSETDEPVQEDSSAPVKDIIGYAQDYIQAHYRDSSLSMAEVAQSVALSYSHFSALFRARTGMTFPAYLLQVRINQAIELMKDPDLKMSDICYKVGFKYPQQFSRDFKKVTGLYPTQYLQRLYSENPEEQE